jgi:hypothetical protein
MNCKNCKKALVGKQTKYCGNKCKSAYTAKINYNRIKSNRCYLSVDEWYEVFDTNSFQINYNPGEDRIIGVFDNYYAVLTEALCWPADQENIELNKHIVSKFKKGKNMVEVRILIRDYDILFKIWAETKKEFCLMYNQSVGVMYYGFNPAVYRMCNLFLPTDKGLIPVIEVSHWKTNCDWERG